MYTQSVDQDNKIALREFKFECTSGDALKIACGTSVVQSLLTGVHSLKDNKFEKDLRQAIIAA